MYLIQITDTNNNIFTLRDDVVITVCVPCVPSCVPFLKMVHSHSPRPAMLLALCVPCVPFLRVRVRKKIFINSLCVFFNIHIHQSDVKKLLACVRKKVHIIHSYTSLTLPMLLSVYHYFQWYTLKNKNINKYDVNHIFSRVYHFFKQANYFVLSPSTRQGIDS